MADKGLFGTVLARCMCGLGKHPHKDTMFCDHCDNPCPRAPGTCVRCRRVNTAFTK